MKQSNVKKGFSLAAIVLALPLVMHFEGMSPTTYRDPVGIPTVCYGETDRAAIDLKKSFTTNECIAMLGASLATHMDAVADCVKVTVRPNEAAALASWSYNIGAGAACSSTLVRMLNAGAPASEWCPQMKRWTFAGGKQLRGLVLRREKEVALCLGG